MADGRVRGEDGLYDRDFFAWIEAQAGHVRSGRHELLDTDNLAEEIESLGKSQLPALRSSYVLIAMHLLKMLTQPAKATASWENTTNRERGNVADLLDEYPSLKSKRMEAFAKAYDRARRDAAFETRMPLQTFSNAPPFSLQELESTEWWPPGFPRP